MSNNFGCNIDNYVINNIDNISVKRKEPEQEQKHQETLTEGSSLDLQPSALAGRSMVNTQNFDNELKQHNKRAIDDLKYFVKEEGMGSRDKRYVTPDSSILLSTSAEDILILEPIAKNFKLDIKIAQWLTNLRVGYCEKPKPESIQRVAEAVKDIDEKSPNIKKIQQIIKAMIFANDEDFEKYNKWLHYINNNIKYSLDLFPCTNNVLDIILFKDRNELAEMYGEKEAEKLDFYEKLTENHEVLDIIRNNEIDVNEYFSLNDDELIIFPENTIGLTDDYLIEKILYQSNNNYCTKDRFHNLLEVLATHNKDEILENLGKVKKMKETTKADPYKYINGNPKSEAMVQAIIEDFYRNSSVELFRLVSTLDKEAVDILMRKRINNFSEYLKNLKDFTKKELTLLKDLSNSVNIDGKPFLPAQKIEFIDLISGCKKNNLDLSKMYKMAETGKIDLAQLKLDLFNQIMKNAGLADEDIKEIPKERLMAWDTKYAHLLAKGYQEADECFEVDKTGYDDILKASNLYDFEQFINDESNKYGKANANTKQMFKELNLDYEKWVHPSKENEIDFVSKDKNLEQLSQISAQILEDMNTLMKTPVKGHIKKQYPDFVKNDFFVIPKEYTSNKTKLLELVESLVDAKENGKMKPVWERAIKNGANPNSGKQDTARATLTILSHLLQRKDDLKSMNDIKIERNLNWKIKMWNRYPQKDLFQGNYSSCCIGIGHGNGHAMPHYLMNTAFNMIEIVDKDSGQTVGNALCYFVTMSDGKPAVVLDNVEINPNDKPSDSTGKELREKIFEYASKIAKDVTGQDDTPVFMSDQYNDIPFDDLPSHQEEITFAGDFDCDNIYLDMFSEPAEWTNKLYLTQERKVLTLN